LILSRAKINYCGAIDLASKPVEYARKISL
jgi:hypothetical protein